MNLKLKDINPNPANPRIIRDRAFQDLKRSIAQFPRMLKKRPIAVIKDSGKWVAIGGNQRTKALNDIQKEIQEDGFQYKYETTKEAIDLLSEYFEKGIPCVDCSDLTPDEQRRFIIADNLPFGEWDDEQLANEWDADELKGWGMHVPVFEEKNKPEKSKKDSEGTRVTDDDYSSFELIMLYENKLILIDTINEIKTKYGILTNENAIMKLIELYTTK